MTAEEAIQQLDARAATPEMADQVGDIKEMLYMDDELQTELIHIFRQVSQNQWTSLTELPKLGEMLWRRELATRGGPVSEFWSWCCDNYRKER